MKKIILTLIFLPYCSLYCRVLQVELQELAVKLNMLSQGLSAGSQSTVQKQLDDLIAEFTTGKRDTKNIESYIKTAKQYFESEDPEKNQLYFYWYARLLLERFDQNYSNLKLSELPNKIKPDQYFKQSLTKLIFQLGNLINDIKKIRDGIEQKFNATQKQGLSTVIAAIENWIKNQTEISKEIREEKEQARKKKIELYALLDAFSQEGKKFVGFNKLRSMETAKILKKYEEVFQELVLADYGTQKEIGGWNEGLAKLKTTFEELEKIKQKEKAPQEPVKETVKKPSVETEKTREVLRAAKRTEIMGNFALEDEDYNEWDKLAIEQQKKNIKEYQKLGGQLDENMEKFMQFIR